MAKLQFHLYLDEWGVYDGGISSVFINGSGEEFISWWSCPPESIDHVDIGYLKFRYSGVKTKRHEEFIKSEFKNKIKDFYKDEKGRFRKK